METKEPQNLQALAEVLAFPEQLRTSTTARGIFDSRSPLKSLFETPSEDDRKFLSKFVISKQKIELYGSPVEMSRRSELIRTAYDKIYPGKEYSLAENITPQGTQPINIVWTLINNQWGHDSYEKRHGDYAYYHHGNLQPETYLDIWNWLNYFDVNCEHGDTCEFLLDYFTRLLDNERYFKYLQEHKDLLNDILKKTKVLLPNFNDEYDLIVPGTIKLIFKPTEILGEPGTTLDLDQKLPLQEALKKLPEFKAVENLMYYKLPEEYSFNSSQDDVYATTNPVLVLTKSDRLSFRGEDDLMYFTYPVLKRGNYYSYFIHGDPNKRYFTDSYGHYIPLSNLRISDINIPAVTHTSTYVQSIPMLK